MFNYVALLVVIRIKDQLEKRGQCRYTSSKKINTDKPYPGQHHWLELDNNPGDEYFGFFTKPKIIYPNMTSVFPFMYDEGGMFCNDKTFILTSNDDSFSLLYLTAVFNSSLAKLWIWYNCPELQGGTREIRKVYFEHFPVPQANEEQTATLAQFATDRSQLTADLQTVSSRFQRTLQRKFTLSELPGKLQNWYLLSYKELIGELGKKKVKLSLSEEAEWEEYFNQESEKAVAIKTRIAATDREIDQLVVALYELTEEGIVIVEGEVSWDLIYDLESPAE